jgi:hypothetical protein
MKVTLFPTDGSSHGTREFTDVDKVDQVKDMARLDGVTHTDVESVMVETEA